MTCFYIGLHHPITAWPFLNCMISVNTLVKRQGGFRVNNWIMDSGAFSQISAHGKFMMSQDKYLEEIHRWSTNGRLRAAVCQDWMCEEFILKKTGLDIKEHQRRTMQSYCYLRDFSDVYIMPVLQGFEPQDYVEHLSMYNTHIDRGAWVGVGSVCKRNGNADAIEDVLLAIKRERPDIMIHGFGLKKEALERGTVRSLLHSCDSMAWSYAGRREEENNANDPRRALEYAAKIQELIDQPVFVQNQLLEWWK
jgi:hypothetical protein